MRAVDEVPASAGMTDQGDGASFGESLTKIARSVKVVKGMAALNLFLTLILMVRVFA